MKTSRIVAALVALAFCLFAAIASAQTLQPNQPVTLAWDYDTATGTNFSLFINDKIVKNYTTAEISVGPLTDGKFEHRAQLDGLAPGKYTLKVRAWIDDPTVTFADSAPLSVVVAPTAPTGLRVIISEGGGVEVELRGVPIEGVTPVSNTLLRFPTVVKPPSPLPQ